MNATIPITSNLVAGDIPRLLESLQKERFYGTLAIQFRAGQPVLVRREQTLLIESIRGGTQDDGKERL